MKSVVLRVGSFYKTRLGLGEKRAQRRLAGVWSRTEYLLVA